MKRLSGQSFWQTLGLYLAGGWLLLQVIDVLVDNTGLPQSTFRLALGLLAVGFPIALITAVVQGSGPSDAATDVDESVDGSAGPDGGVRAVFTWRNLGLGALGAMSLWGLIAVVLMVRAGDASQQEEERARLESEIQSLADQRLFDSAWAIARDAGLELRVDPQADSATVALMSSFARITPLQTDPPGASVSVNTYGADRQWNVVGTTPLPALLPNGTVRIRFELEGHAPLEVATMPWIPTDSAFRLRPDADSADRVWVHAGDEPLVIPGLEHIEPPALDGFWIDRLEVTNREYRRFVEAGGYEDPVYWTEPFVLDGRELSFEEAMARLTDRTGRNAPAGWEAGVYPDGEDDHPVTGVSWYEAAAYASWAGRKLPTVFHWDRAAGTYLAPHVIPHSNFSGRGTAPVGQYQGIGPFGTLDMGGNAREWIRNEGRAGHLILGGGWSDATYMFNDAYEQPSWDRSNINGFRLADYGDEDLEAAGVPIRQPVRDFLAEEPVSDETYRALLRMFAYDPSPLDAAVEERDSTPEDWVRERVSFESAYGERMIAYLYLPKSAEPPYQPVVYFPGSHSIHVDSLRDIHALFLVKAGRALVVPIYEGTYERRDELRTDIPDETVFYRDRMIHWYQDLARTIDYLETRDDIETGKLGYFGRSWGGRLGVLMSAVETRIDAAVLYVGGLKFQRALPEADPFHHAPRVTIPVLMLNGRHDMFFPLETSQKPLYQLLGTPEEHKRHVVAEGGHDVPSQLLIRETLDWLDRYLGPVKR